MPCFWEQETSHRETYFALSPFVFELFAIVSNQYERKNFFSRGKNVPELAMIGRRVAVI